MGSNLYIEGNKITHPSLLTVSSFEGYPLVYLLRSYDPILYWKNIDQNMMGTIQFTNYINKSGQNIFFSVH